MLEEIQSRHAINYMFKCVTTHCQHTKEYSKYNVFAYKHNPNRIKTNASMQDMLR